jgi:hypothetical protein
MGQIILGFIGAYLLYHFIFNFIIPLVRVTRQVKKQVRNFREQVNTQQSGFPPGGYQSGSYQSSAYNATQGFGSKSANKQEQPAPRKDDYIDFEEIR